MARKEARPGASVLRLLDANLNRAREGLRVLEDTARFLWQSKKHFQALRKARHKLDTLTRRHYPDLVRSRSGAQDPGRRIKEGGRESLEEVVAANLRRCEESLRVLEEYGKIFSANAGAEFKDLRYAIYDLEKSVFENGAIWKR